jgi:hypothetical protein
MARRPIHLLALAALALSLTAAGCKQSDTVLLVEVWGDAAEIVPVQFLVTIHAGLDTHAIDIPQNFDPANAHPLPQSFTISMDRSLTGPMTITVDAKDQSGTTIASGTTMEEHPVIGGQTVVSVMLTLLAGQGVPVRGAGDDGGADAAEDAADGMGLDGATD